MRLGGVQGERLVGWSMVGRRHVQRGPNTGGSNRYTGTQERLVTRTRSVRHRYSCPERGVPRPLLYGICTGVGDFGAGGIQEQLYCKSRITLGELGAANSSTPVTLGRQALSRIFRLTH